MAIMNPPKYRFPKYGADAEIELGGDTFYLELDNSHEDEKALRRKVETHYAGEGGFRVIFVMATRPGEREGRNSY